MDCDCDWRWPVMVMVMMATVAMTAVVVNERYEASSSGLMFVR
jgi:hypothetical protein